MIHHYYKVLSKKTCTYCDAVKELLTRHNASFEVIDCVDWNDAQSILEMYGYSTASKTFPLVIEIQHGGAGARMLGGFEATRDHFEEPLLSCREDRYCMFPIEMPDVWSLFKKAQASYWVAEEISLRDDVADYEALKPEEKHFINHVLAFFAESDGIVSENLAVNFFKEIQSAEVRGFYAFQLAMEQVHSEMYSLLIDSFVKDHDEKKRLFNATVHLPAVKAKAEWAMKWLDTSRRFAERLFAFTCVEGILFSGSFASIYWLKQRGILPGLCLSNAFISRDEGLHQEFGTTLYRKLIRKLSDVTAHEIVKEAVDNEIIFINEAMRCDMIGMNPRLMSQYIQYVGDRLLVDMGHPKMYNATNPFDFMNLISLRGKENFFERVPSEYARAGVMATAEDQTFAVDEDF
jgi:ribonucleotide reductase beta subunit family protein with ferritin-like domain/glutaredoxin